MMPLRPAFLGMALLVLASSGCGDFNPLLWLLPPPPLPTVVIEKLAESEPLGRVCERLGITVPACLQDPHPITATVALLSEKPNLPWTRADLEAALRDVLEVSFACGLEPHDDTYLTVMWPMKPEDGSDPTAIWMSADGQGGEVPCVADALKLRPRHEALNTVTLGKLPPDTDEPVHEPE